jgi:hypothetical protein
MANITGFPVVIATKPISVWEKTPLSVEFAVPHVLSYNGI